MAVHMLTTIDNPYNPFTQFEEWYQFDEARGHYTLAFLARLFFSSDDWSEGDQSQDIEDVLDEIVRENVSGLYRKVADNAEV